MRSRRTPAKKATKRPGAVGTATGPGDAAVLAYGRAHGVTAGAVCERLRVLIDAALPKAAARIWHGGPVWFDGENPVVGYDARKSGVTLMFWNGQAFETAGLAPVGAARAAKVVYGTVADVDVTSVRRWLTEARANVFDSKAHFAKLRKRPALSSRR